MHAIAGDTLRIFSQLRVLSSSLSHNTVNPLLDQACMLRSTQNKGSAEALPLL